MAEISLHAILAKPHPTTMKVRATLNTVQANWKEMFMVFKIDGKQYKLQGVVSGPQKSSSFQHLAIDPEIPPCIPFPLQPIVTPYMAVFEEPQDLPPTRSQDHSIPLLPNSTPPNIRPYRYPHSQKAEIEKQVEQLMAASFIQSSTSPFSSPVLLVKKKDNTWRMCVDYRALNKITIADKYPIPNIDELLDELYGATVFSKLDLRSGYYQIRVISPDIEKTAFRTHSGHYEFKVMPFGLTNAPSTFQAVMNDLFRPYLRCFILVFFDDILICSPMLFWEEQVVFLGHVISSKGVSVEEENIPAVKSWPTPTTVKEMREQQRLLLKLMPYDFSIVHKVGKENKGADALSRRPHSGELLTLIVPYSVEVDDIKAGLKTDLFTSDLMKKLQIYPSSIPDFSMVDHLLFHHERMQLLERIIPIKSDKIKDVEQLTKWSAYLPWVEYSYNTGYHMATGTTPFSVVYGREPHSLFPYTAGETQNAKLEQQLVDRDDMIKLLCQNLQKAQDRMRKQANQKRRELSFQVGDYVFLKIQPYRQKTLAKRRYEKLSPRFFGPYRVKRAVGPVAYELELPPEARIHPVFHILMLKPAHGSFSLPPVIPLPITKD
nr:retrotransposon-related protein [Tanacetum cinerariifolium]